jgi:glucokinase
MSKHPISHSIGIDIGGSSIKAGIVTSTGNLLDQLSVPTDRNDPQGLVRNVLEVVTQLQRKSSVSAIGIASTGIVDAEKGVILQSTTIKNYDGTNWKSIMENLFDLPVSLENDVKAAVWGEFKCRYLSCKSTVALIAVGTGIGCGIIVDGQIWRGAGFAAGEIGYLTINTDGPEYNGNVGCLEYYASASSIVRYVREKIAAGYDSLIIDMMDGNPERISIAIIKQAEDMGDVLARDAFIYAGEMLGVGVVNLVHLLNPAMVILGGGVVEASESYSKAAITLAMQRILRSSTIGLEIVKAQLGNKAAVVGAGLLALEQS